MIASVEYTRDGSILATIDGEKRIVPDEMANGDRREIAAWEAAGNEIVPYAAAQPTAVDVKAEAARRIEAIMPDYAQRNALALFAETAQDHGADPAGWPSELQAANAVLRGKWDQIKAIRTASDRLEAWSGGIPVDFADDRYWTS